MRLCKILAVGVLAVLFALPANAAEPYKLRIGWVVAGADFATLMFARPELAPHAGKTYIPELTHFEGTSTAMQALATGELDTAALAYSTFALGVVNAGMQDLRVIGDGIQDGVPGYHTNGYFVRNGARSTRSRISRARSSRPTSAAARSTWRCGRCSRSTICRTSAMSQ